MDLNMVINNFGDNSSTKMVVLSKIATIAFVAIQLLISYLLFFMFIIQFSSVVVDFVSSEVSNMI
jgi:hypothetical protein